jgi:hypothetical protein
MQNGTMQRQRMLRARDCAQKFCDVAEMPMKCGFPQYCESKIVIGHARDGRRSCINPTRNDASQRAIAPRKKIMHRMALRAG